MLAACLTASGQNASHRVFDRIVEQESRAHEPLRRGQVAQSLASPWFDAKYYGLNLTITTSTPFLAGFVSIQGICSVDSPKSVTLDLTNTMHVDSVKVGGMSAAVVQGQASFTVTLTPVFHAGDVLSLVVYYKGVPQATGFGSFVFGSHAGVPWVWSLSEPYGARDWWPCKDHPSDKADSTDVVVTADSSLFVGSNGRLVSTVSNHDGTSTTHWAERYPIAPYLVSVALSNYSRYSEWFHYSSTDSMLVLNYVLPESLASAQALLHHAVDGLGIFSQMFGLYPFVREKYGHSQFGSGAMEHETMTSTATFDEQVIIHELAHQWFGDMITCGSWAHVWLNEGFATYCTALYMERMYGVSAYWDVMNFRLGQAKDAAGPVVSDDTDNVPRLFAAPRIYSKGASALHMLRHVLGDSDFFHSMYNYAQNTSLRYGNALTGDFQAACEQTSGKSLGYFFNEWLYGEGYPHYLVSWSAKDSSGTWLVKVSVSQTSGTSTPAVFTMPVDIRFSGGSWDSTLTVVDSASDQTFILALNHEVDTVQIDPGGWILKSLTLVPPNVVSEQYQLYQNYPNPFNGGTKILYTLPRRSNATLSIYNILGQRVATLSEGLQFAGSHESPWDAANAASGVYFYRLDAASTADPSRHETLIRKMILMK